MTIDKEKLKPCPFCGGPVNLEKVCLESGIWYGVICRNTGNHGWTCAMEQIPSRTADAAIARWSMRKPEDDLRAEIERLEAAVELHAGYHAKADLFDQLKAENEALRKDAGRYRAIRDDIPHLDLGSAILDVQTAEEYDAAVDVLTTKEGGV